MEEVVAYLRAQYLANSSGAALHVSLESAGDVLKGLGDIYKVEKLPRGPWNDPANKHWFTPEYLDSRSFRTPPSSCFIKGWLSINGVPVTTMLDKFLEVELDTYRCLSNIAYDAGLRYVEWALLVTNGYNSLNPDEALRNRPMTAAETLAKTTVRLLGMKNQRPIVETVPFRNDTITMFKVPVRPDRESYSARIEMDRELAKTLAMYADRFDEFADSLDAYFVKLENEIAKLKSFRELVGVDEEPHEIVKFLDREMMTPFITGLHQALFYRARDLADFLRMYIFSSFR